MLQDLWARVGVAVYRLRSSLRREEGQALVEYALILGLIAVVAIATLEALGKDVNAILDEVESQIDGANE